MGISLLQSKRVLRYSEEPDQRNDPALRSTSEPACEDIMRLYAVISAALFFVAVARSSFAATPTTAPALTVVVHDKLEPASPGSVHIAGRLGDKLDACIRNRLMDQDVQAVIAPYRAKTEVGGGDWRCEYWGKWFTTLALADAYEPTAATASLRDEATRELLVTAAPDGYLGTRQPAVRMQGWDTWGCKYALLGLMSDFDRTGDPKVLAAARRHADVLIDEFGPGKNNIEDAGEWNGLPASSVLEPVVLLYERTGEEKYLAFAKHIVACWDQPSKRLKNGMRLIEDATAGKRPSQMCAPKSYEMMSCFEGLCELYRATGDKQDLDAAVALADSIQQHEVSIIGCGTSNEVWCDGKTKQTGVIQKPMETCVTATWMKLNYQLLRLTGESKYADELERNLYNGLLGAMTPDGSWWAYFSGQMGVRVPSYVQHADVGTSCCVLNGPRGLMITPFWAFMNSSDGPVVNLYAPGTAKMRTPGGQSVSLDIRGDYPIGDQVDIAVTAEKSEEFTIAFRIPAWSQKNGLTVNDEPTAVAPGSYARIHRIWKTGDHVSIRFDMRGRIVQAPDNNGQIAIVRGPVVLSFDNRLTPSGGGSAVLAGDGSTVELAPNPAAAKRIDAWMAFDMLITVDGKAQNLTFCDYADAGSAFDQKNVYRTWLPQPFDLATLYKTGQAWNTLSHANHWTDVPPRPVRIDDPDHDLALAIHGAVATADSEYGPEAGCTAKVNDGILATPNDFTNRWHSSVDTPHPHWVQIKLPKAQKVGTVVINFADPAGAAVDFHAVAVVDGHDQTVLAVKGNNESRVFRADFTPVTTDTFRLVIESSANPKYPNAAQVSEIQLFAPK